MAAMREGEVSIHALLAESDPDFHFYHAAGHLVSIHALLAESDKIFRRNDGAWKEVSIHALLAESDLITSIGVLNAIMFQSTLSSRRATYQHVLCLDAKSFQSTLSSRRATSIPTDLEPIISSFNPRSPRGERQYSSIINATWELFQSTLSSRRATIILCVDDWKMFVSIHALLAESDMTLRKFDLLFRVSIHALLAESDVRLQAYQLTPFKFQSTLSSRRATNTHLS